MTESIYISPWLLDDEKVGAVGKSMVEAFVAWGIDYRMIEGTNDYWCRDYMPVHVSDGRYVGYVYRPDYLWDFKTMHKYITPQEDAMANLSLKLSDKMEIILDGGNYVRCGNKVILTDKVFFENPDWRPVRLLDRLENAFEAEVVIIPWDPGDKCGHADGMVACLRNGKLLVNNYHQQGSRHSSMVKSLLKVLEQNFEITELCYDVKKPDRNCWCYLNFIETSKGIILPGLSENLDLDNDIAARELLANLSGKPVQQIYALPLIYAGGALHCVTWEMFK